MSPESVGQLDRPGGADDSDVGSPQTGQLDGETAGVGDAVRDEDPHSRRLVRHQTSSPDQRLPDLEGGVRDGGSSLPVEVGRHPGQEVTGHHQLLWREDCETCGERGEWYLTDSR